jgi:hypothetical protein
MKTIITGNKDKIRIPLNEIYCPTFCIRKKKSVKIFDKWSNIISSKLSFENALQIINQFEKLKSLLLSEKQIVLFNYLPEEKSLVQLEKLYFCKEKNSKEFIKVLGEIENNQVTDEISQKLYMKLITANCLQ